MSEKFLVHYWSLTATRVADMTKELQNRSGRLTDVLKRHDYNRLQRASIAGELNGINYALNLLHRSGGYGYVCVDCGEELQLRRRVPSTGDLPFQGEGCDSTRDAAR